VADDSKSIRDKVQAVWESFFPSSIYFVVFVWIAFASFGFEHMAQLARAGYFDNYEQSKLYKLLDDLELLKLIPIAAVFALAFLIYVFDRLAMMVGNALPPFPIWYGSSVLYVDENLARDLWLLLPDEQNVAALDRRAHLIVDRLSLDKKEVPSTSLRWRQEKSNKASRVTAYAKAGLVWSCVVFVTAIFAGFLSRNSFAIFVGGLIGFAALLALGFAMQTYALLQMNQEQMRVATIFLRVENNRDSTYDAARFAEFEEQLTRARSAAPRYVQLDWWPRFRLTALKNAFFGFKKKRRIESARNSERGTEWRLYPGQGIHTHRGTASTMAMAPEAIIAMTASRKAACAELHLGWALQIRALMWVCRVLVMWVPPRAFGLRSTVSSVVGDARPRPEERACPRRCANSNGRTRVSKDEDGHGVGPHASRRIAAHLGSGSACASVVLRCTSV
jgi:hypothetical protein